MTDFPTPAIPEDQIPQRQRITKACDECRRRKIKCRGDGTFPCNHCVGFALECIYPLQRKSRKRGASKKTDELVRRVQGLENLLRAYISTPGGADSHAAARALDWQQDVVLRRDTRRGDASTSSSTGQNSDIEEFPENAEAMMTATGQLDVDREGKSDYYGHGSELVFFQRLEEVFGRRTSADIGRRHLETMVPIPLLFEKRNASENVNLRTMMLPSRKIVDELVSSALDDACSLEPFVDRASFGWLLERLYTIHPSAYNSDEKSFMPLLYATLALGCLFTPHTLDRMGYECAIIEGSKYFDFARQLLDIADCRDIASLQAVVLLNMFLQCTERLSRCYSYLGVTITLALRMGLHRSLSTGLDPKETNARRRIFWSIWNMDARLSSLLGLPRLLHEDEVDQEMPMGPTTELRQFPTNSVLSACTSLTHIMTKIVKLVYPIKRKKEANYDSARYSVSYARIRGIEHELEEWKRRLPPDLIMETLSESTSRECYLLHIYYAHIQLMLYRPFLHYITKTVVDKADCRAQKFADTCISTGRKIIQVAVQMNMRELLVGAYWFEFYTIFSAILALVFPVVDRCHQLDVPELLQDAKVGRDILMHLAPKSIAANKCCQMLIPIFERAEKSGQGKTRQSQEDGKSDGSNMFPGTRCSFEPEINGDFEVPHMDEPKFGTRASLDPSYTGGSLVYPSGIPEAENSTTQEGSQGRLLSLEEGSQDEPSPGDRLRIQQFGALPPYAISLPQISLGTPQQPQTFAGSGLEFGGDWIGMDSFPSDMNVVDMLNVDQWNNGRASMEENS